MGDENNVAYLPQTDNWRKNNLSEMYVHNKALPFLSVPDRGLHMLQSHGINYTTNELLTIKLHDGLYDPSMSHILKIGCLNKNQEHHWFILYIRQI